MKIEEVIKRNFLYQKKKNFFKFLYFLSQFLKSKIRLKKSYSNWGVDMMADFFFKDQKKGFYVDVGCHHPHLNNNTLPLYKRGWNGINIDLDYSSIDLFNFFRSRDINIQSAVSNKEDEKDLFFFHDRSAINTLNQINGKNAKEIKKIKVNSLNNILDNSNFKDKEIDFLTIDVEGHEVEVLEGLDFSKYKPKLVVLEYINRDYKEFHQQNLNLITCSDVYKFMIKKNYKLINWIHDDLVFVIDKLF